ncbi:MULTISPECIES: folylpolyglutamate synthase/dihydrofolate synthase family protein [unclassified Niallia]|uniref:bifunctional folylpolyglutamate synthase/dihydrofolate synthase n=1 Tax=Niallia TaxID=2837506 RepID=UPI001EDC78B8|nr:MULTISPECIES: folylpolyglutamate synthase/dihydrofolate synthase family protein [unclassified Niallia]MCM3029961.1 bifunctional folylpolyglutamate synthase/dihydrofolate synthase [Niallia sp. MER 6]MDL0436256.1 folylpolyglutamate synthase/dihydrofolate synthase family protein [Niallia sp. SS-2023]UPO86750.1 bifunctional folylpolyglutamate synthase/dihydrofolate synthase [Niallia sp. Man26]
MFQTYEEALKWIHGRLRLGIKPGLTRMNIMMEKLGFPEKKIKAVHVGGTNGKGSTVAYLRNIMESAGLTVGTFTSPYIEQFNERISINGVPIADEEIKELANILYPIVMEMDKDELGGPTEFEIITAMSLYYFAFVHQPDVVLYEVGLGGRFDSTNIITPLLSVITSIGLDHTAILGETYSEIAFEKAGIIKENTPVIAAVKQQESEEVIVRRAKEENASYYLLGKHFVVEDYQSNEDGEVFTFKTAATKFLHLQIGMLGEHQAENAALAVMAALLLKDSLHLSEADIRTGLLQARWAGRLEILSKHPYVLVDGAHNQEGVEALVDVLETRYKDKKKSVLFAALSDKKTDKMIEKLGQAASDITFTSFDFPRAAAAEALFRESSHSNKRFTDDWKKLITEKLERLHEDELLVITGSLYFLSNVLAFWKERNLGGK